mmetsp:Transcript_43991/g.114643  ORF Transcript_43991/g.114643 Transcript_43991/m.114643 type:complete len:83 (+) Transcript_43991:172-420(+)
MKEERRRKEEERERNIRIKSSTPQLLNPQLQEYCPPKKGERGEGATGIKTQYRRVRDTMQHLICEHRKAENINSSPSTPSAN